MYINDLALNKPSFHIVIEYCRPRPHQNGILFDIFEIYYMIKAVIIDDEAKARATLRNLLETFCEGVEVIGEGDSVKNGIEAVNSAKPDMVFLDISMPDGDGFQVLEKLDYDDFEVIFVTAYDDYATKAFDFAALHYLLKPVNIEDLQIAVQRYSKKYDSGSQEQKLDILRKGLTTNQFEKIALPTLDGIIFVDLTDILRLEADGNYTNFHLRNGSKLVISKSLNKYEQLLTESHFFRVHNKHLINLNCIKKYIKGKGGQVVMEDDFAVDVSRRKKEDFMQKMAEITGFA